MRDGHGGQRVEREMGGGGKCGLIVGALGQRLRQVGWGEGRYG